MISLSFLSARFADKSHADSCEKRRQFFADDFSAAEIILLAKMGKQKIASRNFLGALFAPIFSRPLLWTEKAVNFLNREGQKRGATHSPRQERFPLYVAQRCQRCKNVTLCQRVTETPCHIPTVDFYFYVYFCSTIATQDSICAAS